MSQLYLFLLLFFISIGFAQTGKYEGFGSITKGGEGKPVYHVTSLKDDGSNGTLRDALLQGNRYIVFDTAGTIFINRDLKISGSNITIDGSTAPSPGITLQKTKSHDQFALLIQNASDVIITHLRIQGLMDKNSDLHRNNTGTVAIFTKDSEMVKNIVFDHITTRNSIDSGLDIWGEISNITIQNCLIAYCNHPQTISHVSRDGFKKRRNISIHHNIYARNIERNPQLRADVRTVDYINNIVYDWGYWGVRDGYGVRVKNQWEPGEPKCTINIINNAFIPTRRPAWALVYGKNAGSENNDKGPDKVLSQGTVYTDSDMDSIYVAGNLLPKENMDHYSTITDPIPIPNYAKVTTYPAPALADSVVPFVGTHYPLEDEKNIFNAITDSLRSMILYKTFKK